MTVESSYAYEDAVRAGNQDAYLESVGVQVELPEAVKKLGCVNCRVGDRLRHPECKHLYCYGCPIRQRRERRAAPEQKSEAQR